jgi:LPXTG-motif cell wall-anchored protein
VGENSSAHSVPQIAADSAGDSWMPFFIAGLVALASAFAALVFFRNRRRTAQH